MNNWNRSKYLTLKLMDSRRSHGLNTSLTVRELSRLTGVSTDSLLSLLPRWTRWRYLSRIRIRNYDESYYMTQTAVFLIQFKYHLITRKGRSFLDWFEVQYPTLADQYFFDLQLHLNSLRAPTLKQSTIAGASYMEDK
jgi:hypothetical protein